jgi:nickel-dependent lactate racemase
MECVKEGGVIILVGECPDGWGGEGPVSKDALTHGQPDAILAELRRHFEAGDCPWELAPCSSRYLLAKAVAEMKCRVIAVTGINADLARTFIEVADSVGDALRMADRCLGPQASVLVIPDGRRLIPTEGR